MMMTLNIRPTRKIVYFADVIAEQDQDLRAAGFAYAGEDENSHFGTKLIRDKSEAWFTIYTD